MKFTLSTKPLVDALNLGVINSNISKFYQKSCLAQLTADRHNLRINLEASFISSEIILKGSGDVEETVTCFVDCALLKQLVGTFETATTTIEYTEGGIILHSGSSKFNLPKMVEGTDLELSTPDKTENGAVSLKISTDDWKFIKDYQMYAIAMSFVHPVYTRVWLGESGDVIVGDFDNSLFTFSKKNKLGKTCLLSDTIINLITSLPEGAQITQLDNSYRVDVKTDAFEYAAQFTPQYESDEGIGSYSADVILGMSTLDTSNSFKLSVPVVTKLLNQALMLARAADSVISFTLANNELQLVDDNVDGKVAVEGQCSDFTVKFKTALLKSVLTNLDEETIQISPTFQEDEVVGIILGTKNMSVVLGGVE